jgi:hypothetical protein
VSATRTSTKRRIYQGRRMIATRDGALHGCGTWVTGRLCHFARRDSGLGVGEWKRGMTFERDIAEAPRI